MASIRKHYGKWQVHIRKKFAKPIVKSFISKEDADKYAREIESKIDQGILTNYDEAGKTTLRDLLERYRLEVTAKKKGVEVEDYKIRLLQSLPMAENTLLRITPTKIAKLRDSLSESRKAGTVKKYLFISLKPILTFENKTLFKSTCFGFECETSSLNENFVKRNIFKNLKPELVETRDPPIMIKIRNIKLL